MDVLRWLAVTHAAVLVALTATPSRAATANKPGESPGSPAAGVPAAKSLAATSPSVAMLKAEQAAVSATGGGTTGPALARLYERWRADEKTYRAHREHVDHLGMVARACETAARLRALKEYALAAQVLADTRDKLKPAADTYLFTAVAESMAAVETARHAPGDENARARLDEAERLLARKRFDAAAALFSAVSAEHPELVSSNLLERGAAGKIRAEAAKRQAEDDWGFWAQKQALEVWLGPFRTVLQWLFYIALGFLGVTLLGVLRRLVLRPVIGTAVALQDLTAPAAEREVASQALSRELSLAVLRLLEDTSRAVRVDQNDDLDQAAVPSFRVIDGALSGGLQNLQAVVADGSPVSIGPFSFSPRQLLSLLASFFRRPSAYALIGSLALTPDHHYVLTVERVDHNGRRKDGEHWETIRNAGSLEVPPSPGDAADRSAAVPIALQPAAVPAGASSVRRKEPRMGAIEELAALIAFDLAEGKSTRSRPSFSAYQQASERLQCEKGSADREEILNSAKQLLQDSVQADPANWLARFDLATVLRKLGQNEAAVEHFAWLEWMLDKADSEQATLGYFRKRHPLFKEEVQYNLAVAYSKMGRWDDFKQAIELLDGLIRAQESFIEPLVSHEPAGAPVRSLLSRVGEAARALTNAFPGKRSTSGEPAGGTGRTAGRKGPAPAEPSTAPVAAEAAASPQVQDAAAAPTGEEDCDSSAIRASPAPLHGSVSEPLQFQNAVRLLMLARSARAAALTFPAEVGEEPGAHPSDPNGPANPSPPVQSGLQPDPQFEEKRSRDFIESWSLGPIREEKEWISKLAPSIAAADWRAFNLSKAVVFNAYGRVCQKLDRYEEAQTFLTRSVVLLPDFVEAYANLAELYLDAKLKLAPDWTDRVDAALKEAVSISPSNKRLNYLLGRFYAHPNIDKPDKAIEALQKAVPYPRSYARLADVYAHQNDLPSALRAMQRDIAIDDTADYRLRLFIGWVLDAVDQWRRQGAQKPDRKLLLEAGRYASRLAQRGTEARLLRRGPEFLKSVNEALVELYPDERPPDSPSPPHQPSDDTSDAGHSQ